MRPARRRLLAAAVAGAAFAALGQAQPKERVVRIVAKKFEFVPAEINLERGVPVVLEITAPDVPMGFSAPDFNTDVEVVPGKVVEVRLVPDKAGTFEFVCDIFCGDGHEDMAGRIHVT